MEVSYGASGFAAGSGTESFVSSATLSLGGLTSATDYDVYACNLFCWRYKCME